MSIFSSIAGGAAWMAVAVLLGVAALEPVAVAKSTPTELAQGCVAADAGCASGRA